MIRSDEAVSRTLEIENTQAKLEESTKTIILIENNGDQQMPHAREERKAENRYLKQTINKPNPPTNLMVQITPKKPQES